MDAVWALIPENERIPEKTISDEEFELSVEVQDQNGKTVHAPPELDVGHGSAFSKFTHRKTLIQQFHPEHRTGQR